LKNKKYKSFLSLSLVVSTVVFSFAHLSKQSHISSFFSVDCYSIFFSLSLYISADFCLIHLYVYIKYEENQIYEDDDDDEIEPK